MQAAQIAATIATITARDAGDNEDPRIEIDSHANMVVLGAHAFIFVSKNRICNVQPFDPSLGTLQVRFVDSNMKACAPRTTMLA